MLTRREVLTGVAAASIAAIASARDSAMAQADGGDGVGFGCGKVPAESALASFHKHSAGFDVFLKLEDSAAAVFFKELPGGGVEVFEKSKSFDKWTPLTSLFLKQLDSLDGTKGSFDFDSTGADFFLKIENQNVVDTTFESSPEGFLKITIKEVFISAISP